MKTLKKNILILTLVFLFNSVSSQVVTIYSEVFDSGFSGWNETEVTNPWASGTFMGMFWNEWLVNDAESGMPVNECGAAGMGNPSLHVGAVGFGEIGAAYISDAPTNKRITSPAINTTGYEDLTLSFNFIGNGCETRDRAYLQYSIDGGFTWETPTGAPTTANPALPPGAGLDNLKSNNAGCQGQGRWTNLTWNLPPECEDIPFLRIAFVWQNNDDYPCNLDPEDPAFAVDSVMITGTEMEEEPEPTDSLDITLTLIPSHCGFPGGASVTINNSCTGNPTVEWSTGDVGFHVDNLEPGTYEVTISDDGCTDVVEFFSIPFEEFIYVWITYDGNPCYEPVTATANIMGADPENVNLHWNTFPPTSATSVELDESGTYVVTASYGTCLDTDTITVLINGFYYEIDYPDILCQGDTITASLNIIEGIGPYSHVWSTGESTTEIQIWEPGEYDITVMDSTNNCAYAQTFEVLMSPTIHVNVNKQNIKCHGESTGHIMLYLQGGIPPYLYEWDNGLVALEQLNIPAGSYTISITDTYGCESINTFVITEPEPLELVVHTQEIECYGDETGIALLSVIGGTSPYTFNWSNGAITQNLHDVGAGTYFVTVVDDNGCAKYSTANVVQPGAPLTLNMSPTNVRCFGDGNGYVETFVSGGTAPYFYQWSNGHTTDNIYDLIPGFYSLTVTDSKGCVVSDSVKIVQPSAPLAGSISGTHNKCHGDTDGTINIQITGGWPYEHPIYDYTFEWSNNSWQQNLSGLSAGLYTVTVSDSASCYHIMQFEVTEPPELIAYPMENPTICHGMNIQIGLSVVDGGTPPYTISWSNQGYGMTTYVEPLETTTYTVTVTDANSCVKTSQITVNVHPELQMEIIESDEIVCPGDTVDIEVIISGGGVSSNKVYVNDSLMQLPISLIAHPDSVYIFFVKDACNNKSITETIIINTLPVPPISVSTNKRFGCAPLTVEFSENTQEHGRKYKWDFDDGDFANLSFSKNPVHTFKNATTYYVHLEVTSEDGCKNDTIVGITAYPVPEVEFVASSTNISMLSPLVHFTNYTTGGYFYSWDFGDGSTSSHPQPTHTYREAGTYYVSLKASSLYGCSDSAKLKIIVKDETAVWAPTAFTPNNDGLNETFRIFLGGVDTEELELFRLVVYNRWGNPVFVGETYEDEWDGTFNDMECGPGVYGWILNYIDGFGNESTKTGFVTLLK